MNSSFSVDSPAQWKQLFTKCFGKAQDSGTRTFFITYSAPLSGMECFARDIDCEHFPALSVADRSDRINSLLGTQRRSLVFSCGESLDAGILAAAAGTVIAGGFFLLDLSALEPAFVKTRLCESENANSKNRVTPHGTRSVDRLIRLLELTAEKQSETVHFIDLANYSSTSAGQKKKTPEIPLGTLPDPRTAITNPEAYFEQNGLLQMACQHLLAHEQTCILIKGRRGRGKSSLLGRIAHTLTSQHTKFKVTALHKSALGSFEQRGASLDANYVNAQNALIEKTDILLVDEAASLPIAQLETFLQNYKHVVLCTTTEGYEVAGRALDVRLLESLDDTDKMVLSIEPTQCWRWCDNDPLEGFVDQLLLKNLQTPDTTSQAYACESIQADKAALQCQIQQISQDTLAADESLLFSLYTLLDRTHYQSTTRDLAHLLDAEHLQIWVQSFEGEICAALLAQREGNIPVCLHNDILDKKRRLADQLLPQLLAQMADSAVALDKHYLRIVRIAVIPSMRRRELASQLLDAFTEANTNNEDQTSSSIRVAADAIGASFASDAASMAFWKHHGFVEFHRGFKPNPRTGRSASAVMRCFESHCASLLDTASAIHNANAYARRAIDSGITNAGAHESLSRFDKRLLSGFASGKRSMHDTMNALYTISASANLRLKKPPHISQREFERHLREKIKQLIKVL